jgi:hypothetical protein
MCALRNFAVMVVSCWLLGCGRETSSPCPKGLFPVQGRSVESKSSWCESKDKARSQWIEWYKGGTEPRQSCSFRNGKAQGSFTAWHPGGKIWVQGQFENGKKVGRWKQWDLGGAEVAQGDYASGRLVAGAPVAAIAGCEQAAALPL